MITAEQIRPFFGSTSVNLKMSLAETKAVLRENGTRCNIDRWPNKGCEPEVP